MNHHISNADWNNDLIIHKGTPRVSFRGNTGELKGTTEEDGTVYGKSFQDIQQKIVGAFNGKRVNLQGVKDILKQELDSPEYLSRLKQAGFSDEQAASIIKEKQRAIQDTQIEMRTDVKGSSYSDGIAYIGTLGKSKERVIEDILHEIGHSDTKVPIVQEYNYRNRPAFRREYLQDSEKSEYYDRASEAAQRAKAVIRFAKQNYPNKSLDDVYDIIQAKINKGEKLPQDVKDYVYSYNEPKSAKAFLRRAIVFSGVASGGGIGIGATGPDKEN